MSGFIYFNRAQISLVMAILGDNDTIIYPVTQNFRCCFCHLPRCLAHGYQQQFSHRSFKCFKCFLYSGIRHCCLQGCIDYFMCITSKAQKISSLSDIHPIDSYFIYIKDCLFELIIWFFYSLVNKIEYGLFSEELIIILSLHKSVVIIKLQQISFILVVHEHVKDSFETVGQIYTVFCNHCTSRNPLEQEN